MNRSMKPGRIAIRTVKSARDVPDGVYRSLWAIRIVDDRGGYLADWGYLEMLRTSDIREAALFVDTYDGLHDDEWSQGNNHRAARTVIEWLRLRNPAATYELVRAVAPEHKIVLGDNVEVVAVE